MENIETFFEETVMPLVASAGEAKSYAMQALRSLRTKDFASADSFLKQAHTAINLAHHTQTKLIQDELNGNAKPYSLLMVHAQDHLMTAMLAIDLIEEMIEQKKLG